MFFCITNKSTGTDIVLETLKQWKKQGKMQETNPNVTAIFTSFVFANNNVMGQG